jgi:hypothetical protein
MLTLRVSTHKRHMKERKKQSIAHCEDNKDKAEDNAEVR